MTHSELLAACESVIDELDVAGTLNVVPYLSSKRLADGTRSRGLDWSITFWRGADDVGMRNMPTPEGCLAAWSAAMRARFGSAVEPGNPDLSKLDAGMAAGVEVAARG